MCYLAGISLAFVSPWIACGLYVFVALMWRVLEKREKREGREPPATRLPPIRS